MLSIIIVNYKAAPLILGCLQSVYSFMPNFEGEIIVVDNDSQDQSEASITAAFPQVHWIQMGYNSGFARANNAGIRKARYETILLLNPDTLAVDDSIVRCVFELNQSAAVAAGVQLYDRNLKPQVSGSRFVKGGLNHLLPIPYWGAFLKWIGESAGISKPGDERSTAVQTVDWISGAFLMVKTSVLATAGLLDEDFFLYGEEVEWCARLKKSGPLVIFGELSIIHLEGEVADNVSQTQFSGYQNLYDRKGLQLMVSNHLRVRKQYGFLWFVFLLLNYTWGWLLFCIAAPFEIIFKYNSIKKTIYYLSGYGRNILKLWAVSAKILVNRPFFYKMF